MEIKEEVKKKYLITRPEIYNTYILVEAYSPKEAVYLIDDGIEEGIELGFEHDLTLNKSEWQVEEFSGTGDQVLLQEVLDSKEPK